MSDNLLERYSGKRSEILELSPTDEEGCDDCGAFGRLRGIRDRAIMLEIRHKDGKVSALGYAWLESVEFDPSEGITLRFSGKIVRITGRNLNGQIRPQIRLLDGIMRHRVPWIQEAGESSTLKGPQGVTIIEQVRID